MTTVEMTDTLKRRTKIADATKLIAELQSAYRWAGRRIFNAAGGPDLLATIGEELDELDDTTRYYDLGGNVANILVSVKKLWLKLPSDINFTPMDPRDTNDPWFAAADIAPDDSPIIAGGHPVMYSVVNFDKVRFAPALPEGSILRADYFGIGALPDPTTNTTTENGADLPELFHDAICSKAIAQLFGTVDDDREGTWETRARDEINDAIFMATQRVQGPTRTQPYRARRRRFI